MSCTFFLPQQGAQKLFLCGAHSPNRHCFLLLTLLAVMLDRAVPSRLTQQRGVNHRSHEFETAKAPELNFPRRL